LRDADGEVDAGWWVYLVRCGDGTLYAGVARDLDARLHAHRRGRGARYTRGRGPLELVHAEPAASRGAAQRREWAIKQMPLRAKLALIERGRQERGPQAGGGPDA
jgi:predicted GIY-YIG superfamily endonuclease